ncbi:hypothetical protein [Pannonibacter phragmitetus]|uniref:hypothetical protein n=1 Tax=Pannonibacter phragmitetus TaxID=121719 RepID=UPI003D2EAC94
MAEGVLSGREGLERLSLMALGAIPLLTVLGFAEILKILAPSLMARWEKTRIYGPVIGLLVAAVTLTQGQGILQALVAMGYLEDRPAVVFAALACFAGVSLLLFWFEGRIRLPGHNSGVWVLLAIPAFASLFTWLPQVFEMLRYGMPLKDYLLLSAYVLAVIVLVAGACILLRTGSERPDFLRMLLWPPMLANMLVMYLAPLVMVFMPAANQHDPVLWTIAEVVLLVPLMAGFVSGYCRIYGKGAGSDGNPALPIAMLAVPVFAVQVFVFAGSKLLNVFGSLPVMVEGYMMTVCVAVMFSLLQLFRRA